VVSLLNADNDLYGKVHCAFAKRLKPKMTEIKISFFIIQGQIRGIKIPVLFNNHCCPVNPEVINFLFVTH
jgi:hypothetical protein